MKLILIILLGAIANLNQSWAQDIPKSVQEAFAQQYPKAKEVEWLVDEDTFTAEHLVRKKWECEITFDAKGKVLEVEQEIRKGKLPARIKKFLRKAYPKTKLDEIEKISQEGKTFYEVELIQADKEVDLLFDENGQKIEEEVEEVSETEKE